MKALKIVGVILGLVLILAIAGGVYVKTALPDIEPAPELTVDKSVERVERGRYLANHVAVCMDCHSTREWKYYSGPMAHEKQGAGGEKFSREMGFPGVFYAPNLTPYALKSWTDGEIFRAVTAGVNKDGEALFPLMASHRFGRMDKEDIYSIIAYIRTLDPVQNDVPDREIDFPVNFIINTLPEAPSFTKIPSESNPISYGRYLINVAGCVDCHSQVDKGSVIKGTEFGGGMEFKQAGGIIRSPNITPDIETGIGNWSEAMFLASFSAYADSNFIKQELAADELNTPMPWTMYAGMKTSDLKAINAYLKSLKPINNRVERTVNAKF